jgi:hypothetical protein
VKRERSKVFLSQDIVIDTYSKQERTPVRKGRIYCSPFCGYGCTYASFQDATKKSEALARSMGEGWASDVWENLGWHWRVVSEDGLLKVHPGRDGSYYTVFLGEGPGGRWTAQAHDPKAAIAVLLPIAKTELALIQRMVKSASSQVG